MTDQIYIGVGSNLDNREDQLSQAKKLLNVSIVRESPLYETEPVGLVEQPWFVNAVWQIQTELRPRELLSRCQKVERQMGRARLIPK
ncbi:MAG TPA: 2-amino-4-hydroxy-6-hydroxymethyldihydropteridine diphosphokinase, partial [Acidobacteriota bacterium]